MTIAPPARRGVHGRAALDHAPFPLGDERALLVADAGAAWRAALATLAIGAGDEVLVPRGVSPPLLAALAAAGADRRWYDAEHGAEDPDAVAASSRTRALVVSHPLGFPQRGASWRSWCAARGLLLLEDALDALHAAGEAGPAGALGDAAVFGLPDVLGTPDGAVLVLRRPPSPDGPPPPAPRPRTAALLPRMLDPADAARRRANFRALLDVLGDAVPPAWAQLPPGASPLVFPVRAVRPATVLQRLADRGVRGRRVAAHEPFGVVGLPVHHELRPAELERVADAAAHAVRAHPPARASPARLEGVDDIAGLRDAWEDLALQSGNPFATWRWASVWWRHYGGGRRASVLACRRPDGRLLAIVPLYDARRRPVRVARFLGHGPADELGPVCAPADRAEVARTLRGALLARRLPWDVVLAERMLVEDGWGSSLGGTVMRREASPAIDLEPDGWEQYLRRRSRNFRDQVGRRERRLQRAHALSYRLVGDPAELGAGLDTLFALHRARWGAESRALSDDRERFHRDWAAEAQSAGWLRLWLMELDGRAVAAWYGLRFAGREFYYQAGRDPRADEQSVGFVLLAHTIRAAAADGVREYRLLRGGEAYKERFATRDRALETRAVATSARGAPVVAAAAGLAASPARSAMTRLAER